MKRPYSKYSANDLNQIFDNFEKIAEELNGSFKIINYQLDERDISSRMIFKKVNNNDSSTDLFRWELEIPCTFGKICYHGYETKNGSLSIKYNKDQFVFSISEEDISVKMMKLFGLKELQINHEEFDSKFFLTTNNETKFKHFLDPKIIHWLLDSQIAFFDLNTEKSKDSLSILKTFNELSKEKFMENIQMFKYCIERLMRLV